MHRSCSLNFPLEAALEMGDIPTYQQISSSNKTPQHFYECANDHEN